MFLGHFAVGFSAKKAAPKTSLGSLLLAAIFLDALWPIFLLLKIERVRIDPGNTPVAPLDFESYPWSHSLLMDCAWATAFAAIYYAIAHYRTGAIAVWIGVVSHWTLDWITHRPDMPLYPGGPRVGLGLWNSIAATMVVEIAMFAIGVWLYAQATRPLDRIGKYAFAAYVLLLLALYVSDRFSAPPPSVAAVAWVAIAGSVIFLLLAWWFDSHRVPRASST